MISIIIPTLNEEKILQKTLTALRELNSIDYELIVSDGGSTDKTVAIAREIADRVITHDGSHRQTIAEGRNIGAQHALGDYLVFMDADVFIPDVNRFFVKVVECFEQSAVLEGLTVFVKVLPEHVTLSDQLFFGIINRIYQFSNNILHLGAASGEFQMFRTQTFRKIGGYNQKLAVGEDNEIFSRISHQGRTQIVTDLHIMHTSRRAHVVGWPVLLWSWIGNFIFSVIFKRSLTKEWKVIR